MAANYKPLVFPLPDPELAHLTGRNHVFVVGPEQAGLRLDHFVAWACGLSRTRVRALVDFGSVWVQGKVCRKQSRDMKAGETVTMQVPAYGPVKFFEADTERFLYIDRWIVGYDKEPGIPCQQTPYDGYNHLFAALKRRLNLDYLALHHRLDAPTSGVMVFARHPAANAGLSRAFREGGIEKTYRAVVAGRPVEESWVVDRPIAKKKGSYYCPVDEPGRPARTEFRLLASGSESSLVEARPLTGRTHQIRLHAQACGFPVVGDRFYGGPPWERLMLHAFSLVFDHPVTGRVVHFEPLPPPGFDPRDF